MVRVLVASWLGLPLPASNGRVSSGLGCGLLDGYLMVRVLVGLLVGQSFAMHPAGLSMGSKISKNKRGRSIHRLFSICSILSVFSRFPAGGRSITFLAPKQP